MVCVIPDPAGSGCTLARLSKDGGAVQRGGSLTDGRTIEPISARRCRGLRGAVRGCAQRASQRNCDQGAPPWRSSVSRLKALDHWVVDADPI